MPHNGRDGACGGGFRTRPPSIVSLLWHPLMLGFIVAFWAPPTMTQGSLLFAIVTTAYILVAVKIEERDLVAILGEAYLEYRRRTPGLIPFWPMPKKR